MSEIMLDNEDRKLIERNRTWIQMGLGFHWTGIVCMSLLILGLVILLAIMGDFVEALIVAAVWASVAHFATKSAKSQIRTAKLIIKLAALAHSVAEASKEQKS
jgi:hypothetical protein